ncbi:MAG: integrase [Cyclobacteriaceae bacterium]
MPKKSQVRTLTDAMNKYFDYLTGADVPVYERKTRTEKHIKEQKNYIEKFLTIIRQNGINPSMVHPQVSEEFAEWFYEWLEPKGYSNHTFNHYVKAVKTMYKYLMQNNFILYNAFAGMKTKHTATNADIIYESELELLFKLINYENGFKIVGGLQKNFYREWLPNAIKLGLYTGERLDGITGLKWGDVESNYLKIPNWKLRRFEDSNQEFSYVPITADFAKFLLELKCESPNDYLIAPLMANREYVKSQLSKSFSHYWSLTNNPKQITFRHLRKTFETRMWMLLGPKVKGLKRHKNLSTKVDHYLSQKEIYKELEGQDMFNIEW